MKEVSEILVDSDILCPKLEPISPKELNSRKKISCFFGVNRDRYFCFIILVSKKSRVLKKEAMELEELWERAKTLKDTNIPNKTLLLKAPICSKALNLLEELGWRVEFIAYDSIKVDKG